MERGFCPISSKQAKRYFLAEVQYSIYTCVFYIEITHIQSHNRKLAVFVLLHCSADVNGKTGFILLDNISRLS
jgi:hypothetical protein